MPVSDRLGNPLPSDSLTGGVPVSPGALDDIAPGTTTAPGRRYLPASRMVLRIIGRALLVAVVVSILSYVLLRIVPGDPVQAILGDNYTPAAAANLRASLGIHGGALQQLVTYFWHAIHGDLGNSFQTQGSVTHEILHGIPTTLLVMLCVTVVSAILALPLALISAVRPRNWFSRLLVFLFSTLVSTPPFLLGQIALLIFALHLKLAPVGGIQPGFAGAIKSLWLPTLVVCGSVVPVVARVLSAAISNTTTEEFVEMAKVRGVGRMRFTWRHLLRPSLAPTIAVLSYIVGSMFASTVVVETIFNLDGVGRLLINGINERDYPVVQGIALVSGLLVVVVVAIGEIATAAIDPRTGGR